MTRGVSKLPLEPTGRDLAQPMWQGGRDIRGRTIVLRGEQGLGDAIQFVRYAPLVARLGAAVWLEVAPALTPLLKAVDGVAGVLAWDEPCAAASLHCPLMSLPLALGTSRDTIPCQVPYLMADAERVEAWRQRLGSRSRRRIGIAWSGNPAQPDDRLRSIPGERLSPLLQRQDCEFHTVQTGLTATDAERFAQLGGNDHSAELSRLRRNRGAYDGARSGHFGRLCTGAPCWGTGAADLAAAAIEC